MYDAPMKTSDVEEIGDQQKNTMKYLTFIVPIFHVCAEKQSAVKPCDAIGRKEDPALIVIN